MRVRGRVSSDKKKDNFVMAGLVSDMMPMLLAMMIDNKNDDDDDAF